MKLNGQQRESRNFRKVCFLEDGKKMRLYTNPIAYKSTPLQVLQPIAKQMIEMTDVVNDQGDYESE